MTKTFVVKGSQKREISSETAIVLMKKYTIVGVTYNHGQIIYLRSLRGNRIHSIVIQ